MKKLLKTIAKTSFIVSALFVGSLVFAQDANDVLLEVEVVWDKSSVELKNTKADNTGSWFYQIKSNGLIKRTKAETTFLTIKNVSTDVAKNVCIFSETAGLSFSVSYPACATGDQNTPELTNGNSMFFPGENYLIYFTDTSGNTINSATGDRVYALPQVPEASLPLDIISVESAKKDHPSGGEYFEVRANISQTIASESFVLRLRSLDSRGFIEPSLGTIPVNQGSAVVPIQIPQNALPDGSYELVIEYQGKNFKVIPNIGRIGSTDSNNNGGGTGNSGGGIFALNATQQDIVDNGLVPDCGYDINTQSNNKGQGRMCGLTDAITLIQRIIEYIFFLVLPIAAIVFAYVGFLFLTSGGDSSKKTKAKNAMTKLVIGILVIMGAWFLVKTLLTGLGVDTGIAEQFLDLDS